MKENTDKSIVTSCSNKFFPSLLNLIGSIKTNYPNHPNIYVYNLGLAGNYISELKQIDKVQVVEMPEFCSFWRKCYTWKTYIFSNPFSRYTLYLDAGNEVLKDLDILFSEIERDGYLLVEQDLPLKLIVPKEYYSLFEIDKIDKERKVITAGIFGFDKSNQVIGDLINQLHDASLSGLCLGFSKNELWKNKYPNKTEFIRNCEMFRHDTTLLTMLAYKLLPDIRTNDVKRFSPFEEISHGQLVRNFRMNYTHLPYIYKTQSDHSRYHMVNRAIVELFLIAKKINLRIKNYMKLNSVNVFDHIYTSELKSIMDSFHTYPGENNGKYSNIRFYHLQKAKIVNDFINKKDSTKNKLTLLDAGCGTGPYSKIASGKFDKIFSYEYDENELNRARNNLSNIENIEFGQVDLRKIPLADKTVDTLICSEVLEHVENEQLAASELYRVLKNGGSAIVSMPNKNSLFYKRVKSKTRDLYKAYTKGEILKYSDWERVRHFSFSSKDIENIFLNAGFSIVRRNGVNLLPLPTPVRKLLIENLPRCFHLWVKLETYLCAIIPKYCSFYFLELTKKTD